MSRAQALKLMAYDRRVMFLLFVVLMVAARCDDFSTYPS